MKTKRPLIVKTMTNASLLSRLGWVGLSLMALGGLFSCSTVEVESVIKLPAAPVHANLPHPGGTDLSDLSLLFQDPNAPKFAEFVQNCDEPFKQIESLTLSKDETAQGIKELVEQDPARYHWCFYAKLLRLENELKSDLYIDEKQTKVLQTFGFLVPIAKAFLVSYRDSRYMRWAVSRYQKHSEWVFFRKLDLSAIGVAQMVQPSSPFGVWRKPAEASGGSILQKYHVTLPAPMEPVKPSPSPEPISNSSEPPPETLEFLLGRDAVETH